MQFCDFFLLYIANICCFGSIWYFVKVNTSVFIYPSTAPWVRPFSPGRRRAKRRGASVLPQTTDPHCRPRRRASRYLSAMLWKYSFLVSQQRAASNRLGTVSSRSTFHNLCSMTNFLPKTLLNQTCGHWPYIVCENIFTVSDRREHQNGLLPQQMLVLNKFV